MPAEALPILKWAGGKRWFSEAVGDRLRELLEPYGRYVEPFLGGGAMALHLGLRPKRHGPLRKMMLSDADPDLIGTYEAIRDFPELVTRKLEELEELGTDKNTYLLVREEEAEYAVDQAARFIYLNRLCFNGLYRKNKSGKFNIPYGGSRRMPMADQIFAVSEVLKVSALFGGDAAHHIKYCGHGDFIYADPPYHGTFSDYTSTTFGEEEHKQLAEALQLASARGASVVSHNADTPLVRGLYEPWAEVLSVTEGRRISASANGRGGAACVLIVSRDLHPREMFREFV